jgi:hypothetical protein
MFSKEEVQDILEGEDLQMMSVCADWLSEQGRDEEALKLQAKVEFESIKAKIMTGLLDDYRWKIYDVFDQHFKHKSLKERIEELRVGGECWISGLPNRFYNPTCTVLSEIDHNGNVNINVRYYPRRSTIPATATIVVPITRVNMIKEN